MHEFNGFLAGEFLKRWREEKNLSQQEITDLLGYKNVNFISMIERGKAKIPSERIQDFAQMYLIPKQMFIALILKSTYADIWEIFELYNEASGIKRPETNRMFNEWWEKQSLRFGLTKSEWGLIYKKRVEAAKKRLQEKHD